MVAPADFVPKMIATDIDGTMIRSDGTLSPRVRTALHDAADAGIHVVPATGRPEMVATDVIEALALGNYWVFANGAMTRNLTTNETIRGYWMDPAIAQSLVVEMRQAFPGAGFAVELEFGMAFEAGFEKIVPTRPPVGPIDDILDGIIPPDGSAPRVQKVLVFDPERTIDELHAAVGEALGDHGVPSYSGLRFIEVSASLVTKALALEALCIDLGIASTDVAAFGDNHNDVAMLEWAGQGYAMANATDDAKVAAGQTIGNNNDDGLAHAIEAFLSKI